MKQIFIIILCIGIKCTTNSQTNHLKLIGSDNSFQMESRAVGQCKQFVPKGWSTQTNQEGTAIDLTSQDKSMYAGYIVFPMMPNMRNYYPNNELYSNNPQVVISKLAGLIVQSMTGYEDKFLFDNTYILNYGKYILTKINSNNFKGSILYTIIPGDGVNVSNYIALRIALAKPLQWNNFQDLLSRVAFSIKCDAIYVDHDFPIVKARISSNTNKDIKRSKEDDYNYNPQLGTEEAHNSATGENFTFSQNAWNETGPQGPGYYVPSGNSIIKLSPGRAKE